MKAEVVFMKRVIRLAQRGRGKTSPNPMVGAVVVRNGKVVGEGYHHAAGKPHAEILALSQAGKSAEGGTLYTSLEPCCHTDKRTPPCTDAIIQSGIRHLVSAMKDPNPKVCGKGFEILHQAGIAVTNGILSDEAERLNETFISYIQSGRPFVTLKAAMTLDGRIATASGESKWISGEKARKEVDRMRADVDGVMVGIGTVMADDPMLTLRKIKGVNPIRIIIDPYLDISPQARVVISTRMASTLLLTTPKASPDRIEALQERGVQVALLPEKEGIIPFNVILDRLGKMGITSLLVEGGGGLNGVALRSGLVDRVVFYISPKFLCGDDAIGVVTGKAIPSLVSAIALDEVKVKQCDGDIRVEGRLRKTEALPEQSREECP